MPINLKLTRDIKELKTLMAIDSLASEMALCDDIEFYDPDIFTCSWFKIIEDEEIIGLFVLQALTDRCASFHGGLYKTFRHQHTAKILHRCLDIIHNLLPYSLITYVNINNIPMIKVLEKTGLTRQMTIKNGYKTGDMLVYSEDK